MSSSDKISFLKSDEMPSDVPDDPQYQADGIIFKEGDYDNLMVDSQDKQPEAPSDYFQHLNDKDISQ